MIKVLLLLILSSFSTAYSQETIEPVRDAAGVGFGLNPLCLGISEEKFACNTVGSIYAASDHLHMFAKLDLAYLFLPKRKYSSKADETGEYPKLGPRKLYLTSYLVGVQTPFYTFAPGTLVGGIGIGRYFGEEVVSHTTRSKAEEGPKTVDNPEVIATDGTVLHGHLELNRHTDLIFGGVVSLVVSIDAFFPSATVDDEFPTGQLVTMPTPQLFWMKNLP